MINQSKQKGDIRMTSTELTRSNQSHVFDHVNTGKC